FSYLLTYSTSLLFLFFCRLVFYPVLLSFPTRRSSDLFLFLKMMDGLFPGLPLLIRPPPRFTALPAQGDLFFQDFHQPRVAPGLLDRKSTRLNSSHGSISYAVFCLKKKK